MTLSPGAPRPRVLLYGFTPEEVEEVRPLAGSIDVATTISGVHPEEHDVLLLAASQFHDYSLGFPKRLVFAPPPELEQIGYVIGSSGSRYSDGSQRANTVARTQFRPAKEFVITDDARSLGIESLVRRSCVPAAGATYTGFPQSVYPERNVQPFVQEQLLRPLNLAAILERNSSNNEARDSAIWLPDIARAFLREWTQFALAHWRAREPGRFPVSADWLQSPTWASPDETAARLRLANHDRQESERREIVARERAEIMASIETAQTAGASWREMLTATGDDLVSAVKSALEGLGFGVIDADSLPEHRNKKREDLRVTDDGWVALVEVKGYNGAAKSNDLVQLTGVSPLFSATHGRIADALWYVPNVQRDVDPAQRGTPLADRDDDLEMFAEQHHGCVIDTRELFLLRQRVSEGSIDAKQARADLKASVGRYVAPLADKKFGDA